MISKIGKSKIKSLIIISLILLLSFFNCVKATSFNDPITSAEEVELKKYDSLVSMVDDIFSFSRVNGSNTLLNRTEDLLYALVNTTIVRFEEFSNTRLYKYIQATALLLLMISFMIGYYQENSTGYEKSYLSKILTMQYIKFIFALIIIIRIKTFVIFIMSFFRFLLEKSLDIKNSAELGTIDNISNIINTKKISYNILTESGLINSTSAIEEVAIRSKEASIRSMYMLPWVANWVGRVGEIVIVFFNTLMLLVYSIFYPIAMTDVINDFKKSRFLTYSRHLLAFAVQEVVIITIIYIGELVLNYFIKGEIDSVINGTSTVRYLNLAIIITSLNLSKFLLMLGSFSLSKKLMGVV